MAKVFILSKFKAQAEKEKEVKKLLKEMIEFGHETEGLELNGLSQLEDDPSIFLTYSIFDSPASLEQLKKVFQNDMTMAKKYMELSELLIEKPEVEAYKIIE